jgi:hypothetical protein
MRINFIINLFFLLTYLKSNWFNIKYPIWWQNISGDQSFVFLNLKLMRKCLEYIWFQSYHWRNLFSKSNVKNLNYFSSFFWVMFARLIYQYISKIKLEGLFRPLWEILLIWHFYQFDFSFINSFSLSDNKNSLINLIRYSFEAT